MKTSRQTLQGAGDILQNHDSHLMIAGASGFGKTYQLMQLTSARLHDPRFGVHLIDPDGEVSNYLLESSANPANGLAWRRSHFLNAASPTETFGLSLLDVPQRTPQLCHEAAIRVLAIFEQVLNFGLGEYGPRLAKLFLLGVYGLGLAGWPLTALTDLFTLGAARLRELIGGSYPYQFMSEEWRSLDVLSERNPSRFLEYTESITSRLMPTFGNPRMRRIYGQSKGIDLAKILAAREAVILDLSGLEHKDAVLVGTSYTSLLFHEALKRPPGNAPRAFFAIDEVFDYLTEDLARAFDRLRKRNVQLCVCLQRFGQMDKEDDKVSIRNAILTNTGIKIFFGGLDPDDAELASRILFTGDLQSEWKPGSERPVAVGSRKTTVANWSRAHMQTETHMTAHSRARSRAASHTTSSARATGSGEGDAAGINSGLVLTPPYTFLGPNAPNASMIEVPLSQSRGESSSSSTFTQVSDISGKSVSEMISESEGTTEASGTSYGSSETVGGSEAFITDYQWMPSAMDSLQETLLRRQGELMNLAPREVYLKVRGARPIKTRTTDLPPAFRSARFKRVMLPHFRATAIARCPYIRSADEVDAEIACRLQAISTPDVEINVDFAEPEPATIIESLERAQQKFKRSSPPSPTDEPPPRGKPNLRVFDGGKDGDNS